MKSYGVFSSCFHAYKTVLIRLLEQSSLPLPAVLIHNLMDRPVKAALPIIPIIL